MFNSIGLLRRRHARKQVQVDSLEDMRDNDSYRVHLCVATALFLIFIALYVAQSAWRSRPLQVRGEPAPAEIELKPICSFNVFREIARNRADGFVSGNGTWKRNSKGVPEHFQPEICRFRYKIHIPRREVLQCILRLSLRYVVFGGDSNSMRYFAAFQTLLTDIGAHCLPLQASGLFCFKYVHRLGISNS